MNSLSKTVKCRTQENIVRSITAQCRFLPYDKTFCSRHDFKIGYILLWSPIIRLDGLNRYDARCFVYVHWGTDTGYSLNIYFDFAR